jgi:hypothetical protein
METFTNKKTLRRIVSELAAVDNLSINQITKSNYIRCSLKKDQFDLPKNPSDVLKLIYEFYEEIKAEQIEKFRIMKTNKLKGSVSVDEWASFSNKRFLNVIIHHANGDQVNLGMTRMIGSCSAEMLVKLVTEKLLEFELSYEDDIVCTTNDGASVMIKFGKLIPSEDLLSLNHGIHLGVIKVFYNSTNNQVATYSSRIEYNTEDDFTDSNRTSDTED